MALPAHQPGDGTPHSGAALHLFATGVARRVVKADVASLYPSLMRAYRIGPARDHLGAMLALVDRLVERRLAAKASARAAPPGSAERYAHEAMSAAMKLVVNSAYGYLAAGGDLTRFADVHAANEVTRRGRETLELMCRELAARGVTLLEADTDGVYFAVPEGWSEADERRVVAEVAALLPPLVQLEFDGRYAAMLSHEPKNYALLGVRRLAAAARGGVSFEPRGAVRRGVPAPRDRPVAGGRCRRRARRLRRHPGCAPPPRAAGLRGVVQRAADQDAGASTWRPATAGASCRTKRCSRADARRGASATASGFIARRAASGGVMEEDGEEAGAIEDGGRRDYDVDHYARVLRETFAARLARAFTPADYRRRIRGSRPDVALRTAGGSHTHDSRETGGIRSAGLRG